MKRSLRVWFIMLVQAVLCLPALLAGDQGPRPNIIYVLADDLGWTDTAVYGSQYYETPNIDRLAEQGIRFTRYHNCQNLSLIHI